jgi:hypothetical protein
MSETELLQAFRRERSEEAFAELVRRYANLVYSDYDFANQVQRKFDWTTHTDTSGRFEWDSAPADEVAYWFEADGYEVIRGLPLRADGKEHEITLRSRAPNQANR